MAQQFNYGGQAVIEGVMMRGSSRMAVVVRAPDNSVVVHVEQISSPLYNATWSRVPFVRGLSLLWDSLGLGTRALAYSAKVAAGDQAADLSDPVTWGTLTLSLLFALGIFFVTPLLLADGIQFATTTIASGNSWLGWLISPVFRNLVEGVARLLIAIGYIWAIGRIPEIKRVFAYHGAEHKTINAFEGGAALTPAEVSQYPLTHPRCGTGFLLVVMVVSILVFSLSGNPPLVLRYLLRLVLVPVIATVAYEYVRFTARHMDNRWVRTLVAPQLALQRLTTREPTMDMLEVSIEALTRVLESEAIPVPVIKSLSVEAC